MLKPMLIAWLNDAHAMESRSLPMLRRQVTDTRRSVEMRLRLESHVRETEQHADRVVQALRALGSAPSVAPTEGEAVVVLAKGITARVFSDPLVKNVIAELAAEQFEVAAYTALIAAAEQAGEAEVARLCRLNRGEDEEMAEWLDAQIPIVIAETLKQPQ